MEPETPDTLRSSVRDLVALSTLPGLWMGREVGDIVAGLVDVAVTMGCGDACPVLPGKRYLAYVDSVKGDGATV